MTDTVRIMPRQPIMAEPPMFPDAWERPVWCIPDCDGDGVAVPQADWVEVSDPIVWDGTDEAFKAIRDALGHGQGVLEVWLGDDEYEPHIEITSRCTLNRVGLVVHGAGVRIEGDSFVILPPKDGDA